MRSTFTIFSNGSIIQPGFKFTELHALTLAAHFLCAVAAWVGLLGRNLCKVVNCQMSVTVITQ